MILISLLFWLLDVRTKNLVEDAKCAISYLECHRACLERNNESLHLHPLNVIAVDRDKLKNSSHCRDRITYEKCFECTFFVVGLFGFIIMMIGVCNR